MIVVAFFVVMIFLECYYNCYGVPKFCEL